MIDYQVKSMKFSQWHKLSFLLFIALKVVLEENERLKAWLSLMFANKQVYNLFLIIRTLNDIIF